LIGFPQDLIWSLFAQPDQVVELHVAEIELPPAGTRATIRVQRGRFRLSGGTIALRPGGADPVQLASVTDVATGSQIKSESGQVIIDVHGPSRYRLAFERYR